MRPHTGPIASVRRGGLIGSPALPASTPGSSETPRQVRLGIRDDGQFSRDRPQGSVRRLADWSLDEATQTVVVIS